jgi:hypothetical protein
VSDRPSPRPEPAGLPLERAEEECSCPRLDLADWHEVESDWSDITFLRTGAAALLGVPVGYEPARKSLYRRAGQAGLAVPEDAMLLIGKGRFRRPLLLEVEGAGPGQRGLYRPGGVAFSRLVPAPWGQMKRVAEETRQVARARYGHDPHALWVWYLTCRICSAERNFETLLVAHYREAP